MVNFMMSAMRRPRSSDQRAIPIRYAGMWGSVSPKYVTFWKLQVAFFISVALLQSFRYFALAYLLSNNSAIAQTSTASRQHAWHVRT
jgi:hypothetical protein